MNFQYPSYIIILILGVIVSIIFIWQIWKNRIYADSRAGILLVASCLIWMTGKTFQLLNGDLQIKILMDKIEYIGIAAVPLLYLLVVIQNTGYKKWITVKKTALLPWSL